MQGSVRKLISLDSSSLISLPGLKRAYEVLQLGVSDHSFLMHVGPEADTR